MGDDFGHGTRHDDCCGSGLKDDARKNVPLLLHISCQAALGETVGSDTDDILDQAQLFQSADDVGGGVDLPPVHAVIGRAREGVMVIVPPLTHRKETHEEVIPALVGRDELAATIGVADRINSPSDMMIQEHPDEATPDESIQAASEAAEGESDKEGDQETQKRPDHKGLADEDDQLVLEEGAGVARNIRAEIIEDPADMGMEEALHRAVRIHVLIGVGMMLDVGGCPVQCRPLKGHRSADQEEATDPVWSLKPFVGEHSVIADSDSQGAEGVPHHQQDKVDPGDETPPEAVNGKSGGQKRNPDYKLENDLVARGNGFIGHKQLA